MIAKASAIQHGQAMTNYATKNNRADIVKTNHLSEGLPPMGMWDEMVLHQSMFKQRYAKKPIELTLDYYSYVFYSSFGFRFYAV